MGEMPDISSKNSLNPMALYTVIKQLGKTPTKSNLKNLRQINSEFYNLLSSVYFDLLGQMFNLHETDITEEFSKDSLEFDIIHTYRTLHIESSQLYFLLNQNEMQDPRMGVLETLSIHITKIKLSNCALQILIQNGDELLGFLQNFQKLKQIDFEFSRTAVVRMDDLNSIINIISRTNIRVGIPLHKLGFGETSLQSVHKIGNIRVINYSGFDVETPHEFEAFIEYFLKYKQIIDDRNFSFYFWSNNYHADDQGRVKSNLAKLAPYTETLSIDQRRMQIPWDILADINWSSLKHLSITKYQHPLKFLTNHCPKLETLDFDSCGSNCFIVEEEKCIKENLQLILGKLSRISSITFWNMDHLEVLLFESLYQILPEATSVRFMH